MHNYLEFNSCKVDKSDLLEFLDEHLTEQDEIVSLNIVYQYTRAGIRYNRYEIFYRIKNV